MTKFAGVAGVAGEYLPAYARETVKNDRQCVFNTFSPGSVAESTPRDPRNPRRLTRKTSSRTFWFCIRIRDRTARCSGPGS
jgi:hypothetical protein